MEIALSLFALAVSVYVFTVTGIAMDSANESMAQMLADIKEMQKRLEERLEE